jgi:chemotaxis protein MotB
MAFAALAACALSATGCAHTEDEYRARVREVADLKSLLAKAEAQEGTSKRAAEDQGLHAAQMERELRAAGLDPAAIGAGAEEHARALEVWRRRSEQAAAAAKRFAALREKLAALAPEGVVVTVRSGRVVVRLPDRIFDAGRETLRREGKEIVARVGAVLRGDPALAARAFQIAGHVDAKRPGGAFKDAYGLSAMRAREVLAALVQPADKGGGGMEAARLSAAGFGDADPLKGDDSPAARAENRRCEIVEIAAPEEALDLTPLIQPARK